MKEKIKMRLLVLSGQGDVEHKLLDQTTWDWIRSPRPAMRNHSAHEVPPESVRKDIFKALAGYSDSPKKWEEVKVMVSSGSCENDRMLACHPYLGETELCFYSTKEVMEFVREHNIEIVEEVEGCIY